MRTCPVCGSNDSLVSVPGVVAQGTQHSHGGGVSHGRAYGWNGYQFSTRTNHAYHSTSSTELAAALSFPRVPAPLPYGRVGIVVFFAGSAGAGSEGVGIAVFNTVAIGVPFALSLGFAGLVLSGRWASWGRAIVAFVAAMVTFVTGATMLLRAVDGVRPPAGLMTTVMALLFLLGIAIMIVGWRERRTHRRALAQQRRAYQLWQGLYYCARDHVVLEPESGRYGSPQDVGELIYP
ncbi:hypothetical protein J4H86_07475 [Spiractinospora alimapuensis]|uniref:hypothetical protein n=1 Tax=Spiractinospora alimapuensis TaxID=2820884 RepID=UPI001F3E1CF2|nr:hypothetical protein [Spiractinospora alimapuensis]QVQ53574.1 hypothetical protein J4H86_07475 [Spiractinospora alimapuensis]